MYKPLARCVSLYMVRYYHGSYLQDVSCYYSQGKMLLCKLLARSVLLRCLHASCLQDCYKINETWLILESYLKDNSDGDYLTWVLAFCLYSVHYTKVISCAVFELGLSHVLCHHCLNIYRYQNVTDTFYLDSCPQHYTQYYRYVYMMIGQIDQVLLM